MSQLSHSIIFGTKYRSIDKRSPKVKTKHGLNLIDDQFLTLDSRARHLSRTSRLNKSHGRNL